MLHNGGVGLSGASLDEFRREVEILRVSPRDIPRDYNTSHIDLVFMAVPCHKVFVLSSFSDFRFWVMGLDF